MKRFASRPVGRSAFAARCAAALTLGCALAASPAHAQEPDPEVAPPQARALIGPMAGVLTALIPFAVGGTLLAQDDRPDRQRQGTYLIVTGFAAAPWVSHAVTGRWRRAVGFGLASLATSVGTLAAMWVQDPYAPGIANHQRLPFGILLTSAFFAATVGVMDSFIEGPLAPQESP